MRRFRTLTFPTVVCLQMLVGCSHIPDPAAVHPNIEPADVLRSIRCEIGVAILNNYPSTHWIYKADVAYGLTLRAEENATAQGALGFVWPIHLGTVSLGLTAGKEKFRVGENVVNMAEGLMDPVRDVKNSAPDELPCQQREPIASIPYPIVGSLEMGEVVRRFVEVNRVGKTSSIKDSGFTQTLKFNLKFLGGAKPSFIIKHAGGREVSGNVDLKADRKDIHELIIKMAVPKEVVIIRKKEPGVATAPQTIIRTAPDNRRQLLRAIEMQQDRDRLRDTLRDVLR